MSARDAPLEALAQFADDLDAVAKASTSGKAVLMASSQAAPVAIAYAVRHPDKVRGLIIAGGFAVGRALRPTQDGELDEETAQSMIRSGWGRAGSVFLEGFARLFAPDGTVDEIADLSAMQSASVDAETAITLRQVVDRFDATHLLSSVRAPTLILHARGDVIHPLSQGQVLAANIPSAQLVTLEGRNHVLLPSSAAWPHAMAAIDRFLAAHP